MDRAAAPVDFSVADCFKNAVFSDRFKSDSLKANYVMKGTQVWRAINLENRQNGVLFNSTNRCVEVGLFEIIKFGLFEKKLNAFYSDDFNAAAVSRISPPNLFARLYLQDSSEVMSFDADGNSRPEKMRIKRYLVGSDVKGYLIKEDWILNSYTGKTEKYVIGLAPLVYDAKQDKTLPLFWLYYPEWEELLAGFEAKNFYSVPLMVTRNWRIFFRR